jgi:hypothetical protein
MSPEDLADDLSGGLLRQWIKGRATLTAEDVIFLDSRFRDATDDQQHRLTALIREHLSDHEADRLTRMIENEMTRRGERL